jgi:hypothetical protein
VISTRDVTFDESEKYDLSVKDSDPSNEIIKTIRVPDINKSYDDLVTDKDESEYAFTDKESTSRLVAGPASENTLSTTLNNDKGPQILRPLDNTTHTLKGQIITLRPTPERGNPVTAPVTAPVTDQNEDSQPLNPPPDPETARNNRQGPRGPRTEGIDRRNITKRSRTRKPPHRDAYLTDLSQTDQSSGFHSAFQIGSQHYRENQRIHRTTLPALPRTWKDLDTHPYRPEFKAAARKEYSDLDRQGTF